MKTNRIGNKTKVKSHIGTYLFLTLWSLYILVPFYIMFNLATKTQTESTYMPFTWGWKQGITFDAFKLVFDNGGLDFTVFSGFLNTLLYTIPTVIVGITVGTMSAYAWCKLEWKSKKFIFGYLMFGMLVPSCTSMSTSFMFYDMIGWVGTPLPLMIPGMFCGIAQVFFLKQFMTTIPNDLIDAAKIDGLGAFAIFVKIIVPLSLPAMFTQALFAFMGSYNNYLSPLIYLDNPSTYTLQIALKFHASNYKDYTAAIMAASFVSSLPLMLLYAFLQKYILQGLNMGTGLKG